MPLQRRQIGAHRAWKTEREDISCLPACTTMAERSASQHGVAIDTGQREGCVRAESRRNGKV